MSRKKNIDATDIQLLNHLQMDAAITNKRLSDMIGLSPGPTLTRTNKLIAKRAIDRIVAQINYPYFGYNYRAMVVARIPVSYTLSFSSLLRGLEFVLTAHRLKAPNTLSTMTTVMFEVVAKSEQSFVNAMAKQYQNLNYSVDFEIFPVESIIKDSTALNLTLDDIG